jgi:ribosomal protein L39E
VLQCATRRVLLNVHTRQKGKKPNTFLERLAKLKQQNHRVPTCLFRVLSQRTVRLTEKWIDCIAAIVKTL